MKNVLTPSAKSFLMPLGLSEAASTTYATIQKEIHGSETSASTISREEMKYIMKIVKSLEESGLLIKAVAETNANEAKNKMVYFLACY